MISKAASKASPAPRRKARVSILRWRISAFGALWLLVFSIPWGDMVLLPYDVQVSRALTALVFLAWFLSLARGRRFRPLTATHLLMLAFVAWAGSSVFYADHAGPALRRLLSYSQLLVDALLIYQLVRTRDEYRRALQAYVLGLYVAFAGLMFNFVRGAAQGDGRYTAPGFDPNDLAATFALGIPIALYLTFTSRRSAWWYWLSIPCALTASLLTASRGGLVTLAVGLTFPILAMPKIFLRAKLRMFLLVALCGACLLLVREDLSVGRLTTIVAQLSERDMNGRVDIWRRAFEVFLENPVLGVGAGAFRASVVDQRGINVVAHNTYLGVLADHGAVGMLWFVAIVASLLRRVRRSALLERRLWSVLLLAWGVTLSTLSWENRELTWLLWGLCSALPVVTTARRRHRRLSLGEESHSTEDELASMLPV